MTSHIVSNTSDSTLHVIVMVIYIFNYKFELKYGENSSKSSLTSSFDVILSRPVGFITILNTPMISRIVLNVYIYIDIYHRVMYM